MSLGFWGYTANAQVAPKPPVNLCVAGSVCVATAAPTPPPAAPPSAPSPSPSGTKSKKWNPGNYIQAHAAHGSYCGTACDGYRHSKYPLFMNEPNVKGTVLWVVWKYLESDSGNDFTAGFSWLHNEINYIKATYPGKKVGLLFYFDPYGQGLDTAGQLANFPAYFVNAGCTHGTAQNDIQYDITNATCRGYVKRLLAAYGAEFDSEPALDFIRIQQETDSDISGAARDTGWKDIALAASQSWPTTNIDIPINWLGYDTAASKEAMLVYLKSIFVGQGMGDTQPKDLAYPCPSTSMPCVIRGLNASMGASSHDYCGEFLSMPAVELSEQGYNSVVDPPGGLTSQQVLASWNNDYCAQYGTWDLNDKETGDPDTMYWDGAHGQKWAINNFPLTHTSKPAGYP